MPTWPRNEHLCAGSGDEGRVREVVSKYHIIEQGIRACTKFQSWKVKLASVARGDFRERLQNKDTKELLLKSS